MESRCLIDCIIDSMYKYIEQRWFEIALNDGLTIFVLNHSHVRDVGDLYDSSKKNEEGFIFSFDNFFKIFIFLLIFGTNKKKFVKVISIILPERSFFFWWI